MNSGEIKRELENDLIKYVKTINKLSIKFITKLKLLKVKCSLN